MYKQIKKAVIFDMDGVLVDSMPSFAEAGRIVFEEIGINIRREDIYDIEGLNHEGMIKMVFKKVGKVPNIEDFEKLLHRKKEIFTKINKVMVFEGIYECLEFLKKKCLLGVVSGSDKSVVFDIIGMFFPHTFDAVVTGNDVKEGKPSPESYLKAVEMLKVRTDECIVIENSPLGVQSAKRAGLFCIAIPTYVNMNKLKCADIVIPDHRMLKDCIREIV